MKPTIQNTKHPLRAAF